MEINSITSFTRSASWVKLESEKEMANPEHVALVLSGVEALNSWRRENPGVILQLADADLFDRDLSGANLAHAIMCRATLSQSDLSGANMEGVNLREANMFNADLSGARMYGSDLTDADLSSASLAGTNLHNAIMTRTIL